jgi:hypothetical protein
VTGSSKERLQETLRQVQELLERQRLLEDLTHKQEGPRRDLLETLRHRQNACVLLTFTTDGMGFLTFLGLAGW